MFTRKMPSKIKIPHALKKQLEEYAIAGGWESNANPVQRFKKIAKRQLEMNQQNKCAYCELPLLSSEIDHIAPKGGKKRPKYVEYTFYPVNLVLACHDCNSSGGKGQKDVVAQKGQHYIDSDFSIVHPYLDDPEDYFVVPPCDDGTPGAIPIVRPDADELHKEKARMTIKMFHLDTEQKILELAKQRVFEKHPDETQKLISAIGAYKPH